MKQMTSAYANKMLRSLQEDKEYWKGVEYSSCTYVASVNEEAVIPEYDYMEVAKTIEDIDTKISIIKHAINLSNANAKIMVGNEEMSVDTILIRMAQLNRRKDILDTMRKRLPKVRIDSGYGSNASPEYRYINYDLDVVKSEYERVSNRIMEMQMALDYYNQTVLFDVDI